MSELVLEINDIGLTVSDGKKTLLSSPACALLDGNNIEVGEEAFRKSRLRPLWANNRFWSRLDQAKLTNPSGRFQTNADLAHAQLVREVGGTAGRSAVAAHRLEPPHGPIGFKINLDLKEIFQVI